MPGTLDNHKLPDQLPVKGHDSQYVVPSDGKVYGPNIVDTENLPIAYPEGRLDHYSDAEHFIAGAIKHPGALTKKANAAGQSPMAFAEAHKGDTGKTGKQARLAITLRGLHK